MCLLGCEWDGDGPRSGEPGCQARQADNGAYLFDFPDDDDPSVVYLENDVGIQEVTKPTT